MLTVFHACARVVFPCTASAQVKAHRINFELDDLREHSHDGLEAAAAAAAAAASARSGSTDGLTLTSEHLQQQEEQQQQQRHCAGEQEAASGSRARVGSDSVGLGTASLVGEGDFDADLLGGGGHGDGDEVDEGLTGLEAELGEKLLIDDGEEEMEDAREDVEGEEEQGGERDGDVDVERMESGGLLATDEEEEEAGRSQAGEAEGAWGTRERRKPCGPSGKHGNAGGNAVTRRVRGAGGGRGP